MGSSHPIQSLLLLLLLFLLLTSTVMSKTFPGDSEALKAIKIAVEPNSITPGSCLSSWDFTLDPCETAFGTHFTCGIRCDAQISGLTRVTELTLDPAGYSGSLSPSVWDLSYLESLDLSDNRLAGPIPAPATTLPPLLRRIALSHNSFSGEIPTLSSSSLEELYLDNNLLTGSIPVTELPSLRRLELQTNNLTGQIPDLGSLTSLYFFDASDNSLSGEFPVTLPESLVEVSIRNNNLEGPLSESLWRLLNLQVMDLSHNGLSGPVPAAIFDHPALEQLTLSHNRFTGLVEPGDGGLGSRLIAMDLGHNLLEGMLPGFVGGMPRLSALSLEENRFTGMIPVQYAMKAVGVGGVVVPFARLILSGNYLFGPIPSPLRSVKEGSVVVSLVDNCLFRCPPSFFFCQGGQQKPSSTCRDFNPVIP